MMSGGSRLKAVITLLILCQALSWRLLAGQPHEFPAGPAGRGSLVFNFGNDTWLNRDDGYTNGLGLSWVSPQLDKKSESAWLRFLYSLNTRLLGNSEKNRRLNPLSAEAASERWAVLSIVQGMFTPADLTREDLISDDRPYAGLLYAGLTFVRNSERKQSVAGAGLGVVGPFSLAEAAQKWLHRTYGWTDPQGWGNQLKNELVLDIWLNRFWTLAGPGKKESGWQPAVKAGFGGQLGNLTTCLEAILDFRFGLNLEAERDAVFSAPLFTQLFLPGNEKTTIYGFCRLSGQVLVRNLLIEGNTFSSSHGQQLHHFYGQLISGLVYHSYQAAVTFYLVVRTKEFKNQKYFDPYCGLSLSFAL